MSGIIAVMAVATMLIMLIMLCVAVAGMAIGLLYLASIPIDSFIRLFRSQGLPPR